MISCLFLDDANLRSERSVTESSCPSASSYVNVPLGEEDRDIICNCSLSQSQAQTVSMHFLIEIISTNGLLAVMTNTALKFFKFCFYLQRAQNNWLCVIFIFMSRKTETVALTEKLCKPASEFPSFNISFEFLDITSIRFTAS